MRRLFCILSVILFLSPAAGAQGFLHIPWDTIGADSLLPFYGTQQVLDEGYQGYSYEAYMEFPELLPASDEEISRWKLNDYEGLLGEWPEMSVSVGSSRGVGLLDIGFIPVVERGGKFYRIQSFKLIVKRNSQPAMAAMRLTATERYRDSSILSEGYWYKIRVKESGIYCLTRKALASMGFRDPSKVRIYGYGGALLSESSLETLSDDLTEVPVMSVENGLLFYAQGPLSWQMKMDGSYSHTWNTFSQYGFYFLTADEQTAPMSMPEMPVRSGAHTVLESGPDYALYENDAFSWFESGRRFFDSYDFVNGSSYTYSFDLDGIAEGTASVETAFSTSGTAASSLEIFVNDAKAGVIALPSKGSNERGVVASGAFDCSGLLTGRDRVRLHHIQNAGVSGRLDYLRLNFQRTLALRGSSSNFRSGRTSGNVVFRIKSPVDAVVWNVGANGIMSVPSSMNGEYCETSVVYSTSRDEYVVFNPSASFPIPEQVGVVRNQNLHGIQSADMIIVVPSSGKIQPQAERLAEAHREKDGLNVVVVRAEEIYNEFSSGTPDATAVRRFVKMLYDRAVNGKMPRYLLLFGGGAWDNRMITPTWYGMDPDDYLLCYESDNSVSETKSYVADDYYGLLADGKGKNLLTEKVDIGIGRFPAVTVEEARIMVDKTIAYMNGDNAGDWQNTVLILGDDGDDNIHMKQADEIARLIASSYPSFMVRKIYWDAYRMEVSSSGNSYPAVRSDILKQLENGSLLVNYTGHGSPDVLSHELVLDKTDFTSMKSSRLPVWVTASCDIAPFDAAYEMIGKNALLNPDGGALAMLTTARTVFSSQNQKINILFDKYVLDRSNSLGDAVRMAKVELVSPTSSLQDYSENKIHYLLLGDPALHLAIPENRIEVDEIVTGAESDGMPLAQAGAIVTVSGHVGNGDGTIMDSFNGLIYSSVFDSERHIVTGNNAEAADKPFEYDDYDRLMFSGTDSVRNGRFSFMFPVPKDINYTDEQGRMSLFALSDSHLSAHGCFEDFAVGGTSQFMSPDSLGPEISLYLNTPDFEYWGGVNSTPCLVAEISDEDGINSFGNGIGHDILLVVDNDPAFTFNLNGYYVSEDGDYRKGRVIYNIPELPEGRHTLMFRAWDVLNNSSTAYLGFEVQDGIAPDMMSVSVTENPAVEKTSFVIYHDRPGSIGEISVQVADTNGRILKTDVFRETGASQVTVREWDLCGDNAQRLRRGLYVYKVTLTDTDGASTSASGKIVVL